LDDAKLAAMLQAQENRFVPLRDLPSATRSVYTMWSIIYGLPCSGLDPLLSAY
jgi:hypothetical protein